ncbi:uncharacterized protein LOC6523851 [Drosophila yakuba]|uniref:Uncharacterized protein, isoform A n=1 Tax=Drosophila yakuba TaxID=7245 RepID=B4PX46_DROYA|nr:uncharacterized protein LOC6523851 [Drosophila yakuba]XP_015045354.1 uncharacterized protein LOC6523851 [Drosophila yakuba]EDX00832.2 uncharacterized protein Dyak_GE16644, isoform A [Drosophila yakuba]KRK05794.1 uncharacterized protein Dyak_GE16644, isoform B [Drosophila yakuba]
MCPMCPILPLGCWGCSATKACQKQRNQQQKPLEQHSQQQLKNNQPDIQMNVLSPRLGASYEVATSQTSLPSMSPSLVALPHRIVTASTLSSWAGEEELYDMEDYGDRTPSRWTAWWLKRASNEDHLSIVSQQ